MRIKICISRSIVFFLEEEFFNIDFIWCHLGCRATLKNLHFIFSRELGTIFHLNVCLFMNNDKQYVPC